MAIKSPEPHASAAHQVLPDLHQPADTAVVQVSAHMLGVCKAGHNKARTRKRTLARHPQAAKMPSLGRKRIRPCAIGYHQTTIEKP